MNTIWKSPRRIASLLVLGFVLAGCATGAKPPSAELQQRIESAQSRTDHESLAAFYDPEAVGARVSAAVHRKMAKGYQQAGPSGRGGFSLPAHCNSIVSNYDSIAAEYDGMAAEHRRMAGSVQP